MVPSVNDVVVLSSACEIPKSMTRGPVRGSRMFWGLTSRWTTPLPCSASRACTVPAATQGRAAGGNGPASRTRSPREGAGTYSIAIHGRRARASASSTRAVYALSTRRASSTSRANRLRSGSLMTPSVSSVFTATSGPSAVALAR